MGKLNMSIGTEEFYNADVHFSITVTSKCNLKCSYCHFYDGRRGYNDEISQDLFERYVKFIKWIKRNSNIHYRFSGGEPLAMGDRVFDLSRNATNCLKESPYIMTNGLLLNEDVIEKSQNIVKAYVLSMENPFDIDKGSINPETNTRKIKKFTTNELPLIPGAVIIRNSQFKNLFEIANYFYEEIGCIPAFTELSYGAYETPSESEVDELYTGVRRIVEKYKGKTRLRMFPYIIPEYLVSDLHKAEYITELDYENKYDILNRDFDQVFDDVLNIMGSSYVDYSCHNEQCEWYSCCRKVKWVWQHPNKNVTKEQKIKDYCTLKKAISNAYYDGIA